MLFFFVLLLNDFVNRYMTILFSDVQNNLQKTTERMSVPITKAEFAVMRAALSVSFHVAIFSSIDVCLNRRQVILSNYPKSCLFFFGQMCERWVLVFCIFAMH